MTTLGSMDWVEDLDDERRRRFRHAVVGSVVAHILGVALLGLSPEPVPFAMPQAITVDLVAALPPPPSAASPAAKPEPKAVPPPPPPPKPKVKVLPEQAPTPVAKPKPKPKPEPKPEPRRPERPAEMSYEDALAKLRDDIGEQAPAPPTPEPVAQATPPSPAAASKSRAGVLVAPEVAAWNLAVMRHIRSVWITPPEFRETGLAAQLEIEVAADGRVLGAPEVVRSSGNPFFDDNAVRAVVRASPLPAAPKAGRRTLIFTSEE